MTKIIDGKEYFTDEDFILDEDELEDEDEQDEMLNKPLLYIAAPKHIYDSQKFNQYLAKIFSDYSDCDIKVCKYEFSNGDMWMDLWLHICLAIDKLIFVSDEQGCVGYGCWQEIFTVHATTEILYLSPEMVYIPFNNIRLRVVNNGQCLRHYARVIMISDIKE